VHLVNAESQQLFAQGIMESNHYGMVFQSRDTAVFRANKLLKATDCSGGDAATQLDCLRQAADKDLLEFLETAGPSKKRQGTAILCNAFGGFEYWAPMVDGDFVTTQPADAVITKPVMMGTNTNEGVLFASIPGLYPDVPGGGFTLIAAMDLIFGIGRGTEVLAEYPDLRNFSKHKGVPLAQVLTDYIWSCANNQVLNAAVANGNQNVYGYHFTHVPTLSLYEMGYTNKNKPFVGNPCGPDPSVNPDHTDNVCHGNELPYVFGNPWGFTSASQTEPALHAFQADETDMTATVMGLWTDFAKNGAPGGGFPAFDSSSLPAGSYWVLQDDAEGGFVASEELYDDANCEFWQQKIGYRLNQLQEKCDGSS
jgi:carboxylesterase type B